MSQPASLANKRSTVLTTNDAKKFVFFSSMTKGATGRPIKINASLLPHFISLVDPKTHDGQAVIHHIQGLRATAGQASSMQNINNAFEHMDRVKNVQICYKILQLDAGSPVTVYITDIRAAYVGDGKKAGLYNVSQLGIKAIVKEATNPSVTSPKAVINGSSASADQAGETALKLTSAGSTALFYNPTNVINELGSWRSKIHSDREAKLAANELTTVLVKSQNRTSVLNWYVEGEGAALLARALTNVTGDLSQQKFRFIDPTGDVTTTIQKLKNKKAQLVTETDLVSYTGKRAAAIAAASQLNRLTNVMTVEKGKPGFEQRGKSIHKLRADLARGSSAMAGANNMIQAGKTTFLDILKQVQGVF